MGWVSRDVICFNPCMSKHNVICYNHAGPCMINISEQRVSMDKMKWKYMYANYHNVNFFGWSISHSYYNKIKSKVIDNII